MTDLQSRPFVAPAPELLSPVPSRSRAKFRARWLVLPTLALAAGYGAYVGAAPRVELVASKRTLATETLATSGVVEGRTETTLGADAQGTLVELRVDENDVVRKGQILAVVQNRAGENAVLEAEAALRHAQASLAQAQVGSTPEELRAAVARLRGSIAETSRAGQGLDDAEIALSQAEIRRTSAEIASKRALALRDEATARRDLAQKQLGRMEILVAEGAIAGVNLDQAQAEATSADAVVADAEGAIAAARAAAQESNLAVGAATVAVRMSEAAERAARAAQQATEAEYEGIVRLPRPEVVAVAGAAVREAEASLAAARALRQNAVVRAPFDGTVTQVLLRRGASVGAAGILKLVETDRLEVAADVDESNLGSLHPGQRAVLVAPANPGREIPAKVVRLSTGVDASRGTVEVKVAPTDPKAPLRPGQTVDVTLVLAERVPRLVVPASAIRRQGDDTVAFTVRDGRVVAKKVQVGRSTGETIAVLSGLRAEEPIVRDAARLEDGQRVRR